MAGWPLLVPEVPPAATGNKLNGVVPALSSTVSAILPSRYVPMCSETAFSEDKLQLFRDADGLEETVLPNAVGQGREVAHVLAVAVADLDVGDLEFFEHQLRDRWKKSANCSSAGDSESEE